MTSKIFKSILSAAVLVLMASLIIITGVLYQYFSDIQEKQLRDELSLAAIATERLGREYLEELDSDRYRLTWISADGTVVFDNQVDAALMENHGGREEVREAMASGKGGSTRHSETLMHETIYEATRLKDGSILRISVSRATAIYLVMGMLQPIGIVVIIAIILSALLGERMAKKVVEPLNRLDLDNPLENEAYEELSPLLHRIYAQHIEIKAQMLVLKHKQDEFDQITKNMKESLVLLDKMGRILSINPAAKALFQIDESCDGEDFLAIDRKLNMRQAIALAREQGSAAFRDSINGREYQFDISRIDSNAEHHGMVILAFDVTEQVNAEKHRREFTANVSHELKTPLQSIIGSAELMENNIVKAADVPSFVGRIRREATRLVDLIDDIIRLSQIDEGVEMPREEVSLLALAGDVAEILSDSARAKNVTIDVSGDEGMIFGVRRLLYEVVYNLCDNAIKYNKSGGSVTVLVIQDGDAVILRVKDTGIGIPLEHQEKIFERFYRVDKSHSKLSGGTGLGLSIVKHAVQYHDGKIEVDSCTEKGTTISLYFRIKAYEISRS